MNFTSLPSEILIKIFQYLNVYEDKKSLQLSCNLLNNIYQQHFRVITSIKVCVDSKYIQIDNIECYVFKMFNNILSNKYNCQIQVLHLFNCNFINNNYLKKILRSKIFQDIQSLTLCNIIHINISILQIIYNNFSNLQFLNLEKSGLPAHIDTYYEAKKHFHYTINKWWLDDTTNYIIELIINLTNIQILYIPNAYDSFLKREIDFYREQFQLKPIILN